MSASEYKSNLEALVAKTKKAGVSNVMLLTPPPLIADWMDDGWMLMGNAPYEVSSMGRLLFDPARPTSERNPLGGCKEWTHASTQA